MGFRGLSHRACRVDCNLVPLQALSTQALVLQDLGDDRLLRAMLQ